MTIPTSNAEGPGGGEFPRGLRRLRPHRRVRLGFGKSTPVTGFDDVEHRTFERVLRIRRRPLDLGVHSGDDPHGLGEPTGAPPPGLTLRLADLPRDRKSTRLNSS